MGGAVAGPGHPPPVRAWRSPRPPQGRCHLVDGPPVGDDRQASASSTATPAHRRQARRSCSPCSACPRALRSDLTGVAARVGSRGGAASWPLPSGPAPPPLGVTRRTPARLSSSKGTVEPGRARAVRAGCGHQGRNVAVLAPLSARRPASTSRRHGPAPRATTRCAGTSERRSSTSPSVPDQPVDASRGGFGIVDAEIVGAVIIGRCGSVHRRDHPPAPGWLLTHRHRGRRAVVPAPRPQRPFFRKGPWVASGHDRHPPRR